MLSTVRSLFLPEATGETRLVVGLVSASHFVFHSYMMMLPPVLLALREEFHVGLAALTFAVGLVNAVVVLLQLPLGYVSDTYSREAVLGMGYLFGALGAFLIALAPNYWWLLGAQVVAGVGVAGHHPAHYPMLSNATEPDQRGRSFSLHGFAGTLGFSAPFAVSALVLAAGLSWRYAIAAIGTYGAIYGAFCLYALHTRTDERVRYPDRAALDGADGPLARFADALRSRGILALTLLSLLSSMSIFAIQTFGPVLLVDVYGLTSAFANPLVSAMLVTGALFTLVGGILVDRRSATNVLVAGYLLLTLVSVALATGLLPVAALVVLVIPFSSTVAIGRPARSRLADLLSERDDLGKNFAAITIGLSGGGAVAPPLFGLVADAAGVRLVFYAIGALGLGAATLAFVIGNRASGAPSPAAAVGDD